MKRLFVLTAIIGGMTLVSACSGGENKSASDDQNKEAMTNEENNEEPIELTYDIDLDETIVKWKGTMMGMYSHQGTLHPAGGFINMVNDEIVGGQITMDMTTITPTDENYDEKAGKTPEKLVSHLSSDDFFAVDRYPTATFKITGTKENMVLGELTIRGKTNAETIKEVQYKVEGNEVTGTGTLTFDRTKYEVLFIHPAQDMVLSDDIELNIEFKAVASTVL